MLDYNYFAQTPTKRTIANAAIMPSPTRFAFVAGCINISIGLAG
jgi:hypothetical protein